MTQAPGPLPSQPVGAAAPAAPTSPEPRAPTSAAAVPSSSVPALSAVPVALALGERHVGSVRRWLEGTLGWQAVDDDLDGAVPPAVRIVDLDGAQRVLAAGPDLAWLPTVLLVEEDDPPARAADVARRLAPTGVCRWPEGRDQLPAIVAAGVRGPRPGGGSGRVLRVGGVAGGVGTTTITLALTGLAAWSGRRALAVLHGQAGVREATPVPADALGAPDLWSRAMPLPGIASARVVHTGTAVPRITPEDRRIEVSVLDVGTDTELDVVVCRPDGAAAEHLPTTMAGAVVVVGRGLLSPARIRELAQGRLLVEVPVSVRVARAALRGQVPAGLPGSWLASLRPVLEGG